MYKPHPLTDKFYVFLDALEIPLKLKIRVKVFWVELTKKYKKVDIPTIKKQGNSLVLDWISSKSGATFDFNLEKCYWSVYCVGVYFEDSQTGSVSKPLQVLNEPRVADFFKNFKPLKF